MSVADKLLQLNQVKQDIKVAIETKGIPMTNVAFTEYANKILDISGGGTVTVEQSFAEKFVEVIREITQPDYYETYASMIYDNAEIDKETFDDAWGHSLTVDPLEISENSSIFGPIRGTAQYPNGETEGVIIPHSVTSIGNFAFQDWTSNNQPLVIPNSVTSIGTYAFSNWQSNNQPLVIPNSVTSIGGSAFNNWQANDKQLVIPNSVTSIGSYAFDVWQANDKQLVIPNSVTSIGSFAFYNWKLVPYIEIQAITPPTLANINAFSNQNDAPIYVPNDSVDDYKTATNWVNLASRIFSINDK